MDLVGKHTYKYHNGERNIEAQQRSVDLIAKVLTDDALWDAGLADGVLVAEYKQRRQTDGGSAKPDKRHVQNHTLRRPLHSVVERLWNRVIPVNGEETKKRSRMDWKRNFHISKLRRELRSCMATRNARFFRFCPRARSLAVLNWSLSDINARGISSLDRY